MVVVAAALVMTMAVLGSEVAMVMVVRISFMDFSMFVT
jgi:hypothetical protein